MSALSEFFWGVFPYICLVVMIVGTIYRYNSNQLSWTSKSSELLEKRLLTIGSALFHAGIFLVLGGHIMGLLVPMQWYTAVGISSEVYHTGAIVLGGFSGLLAFAGISILLYRRIANRRVRMSSDFSDYLSDGLLWIVIALGLSMTLGYNLIYGPYEYRATIGPWIRDIVTLHPDVTLMAGVPLLFQVHIIAAFCLFAVSPFTRLVHMYSIPLAYLTRAPIEYRARHGYARQPAKPLPPVAPKYPVRPLPVAADEWTAEEVKQALRAMPTAEHEPAAGKRGE